MRTLTALYARLCGAICFSLLAANAAIADVSLPRLLSDGAILQRDKPLSIWGWADEGEKISVSFAGKSISTVAQDGRWSVLSLIHI